MREFLNEATTREVCNGISDDAWDQVIAQVMWRVRSPLLKSFWDQILPHPDLRFARHIRRQSIESNGWREV